MGHTRVHAVGCQDCPTETLRHQCGCIGNTGFNVDRFLDWAEEHLTAGAQVVVVEESYLARRTRATLLGRLAGFQRQGKISVPLNISMAVVGNFDNLQAVHTHSPHAVANLVATEVLRLEKYSQPNSQLKLFHQDAFWGSDYSGDATWPSLLETAENLEGATRKTIEPLKGSS